MNNNIENENSFNSNSQNDKINNQNFIEIGNYEISENLRLIKSFDDKEINLNENLLRGIYTYGYEKPSPIQELAIKPIKDGRDLIAQSQSGTGKTATFVIGSIESLNFNLNKTQVLIISPTRELAIQTSDVFNNLINYLPNVTYSMCIGGSKKNKFIHSGEENQVIIGTPGRISDLLNKRLILSDNIKLIVIDEADEVLSYSFKDQLTKIFEIVPKTAQVCLFSATMPSELFGVTDKIMNNPIKILVKDDELTLDGISQYYVIVNDDRWKFETLCEIYSMMSIGQAIIYCNRKNLAEELVNLLNSNDYTATTIHGNMLQQERQNVMSDFRSGKIRMLIATDIIARGIDVQQVSLVINYEMPREYETYIHRIGRSGRFGRKGLAINFVNKRDKYHINNLERHYNTNINELPSDLDKIIT